MILPATSISVTRFPRSLKACEGAVLLVDASQGVEAQTIANAYLAADAGLEIIPVINKIDLPNAQIDECYLQLDEMLGLPMEDVVLVSAKDGTGVAALLETIVKRVPPPEGDESEPLRSLIFDSHYDIYRGVIPYVRLFAGSVAAGDQIKIYSTGKVFDVEEVGYFGMSPIPCERLKAGDVGYLGAVIREVAEVHVGDTIISPIHPKTPPVSGISRSRPIVFCAFYPISSTDYNKLQVSLEKFQLNDSSIIYEKETSAALGHGFRVGFMGMLHMEIVVERLKREYGQDLVVTTPSVIYRVFTTAGAELMIDNPSAFPPPTEIEHIEEPIIKTRINVPTDLIGPCMELADTRRGTMINIEHPDARRALLVYEFPLAEVITDFYDRLKSTSHGYASMDYDFHGYRRADLVKVDILVNGEEVDAPVLYLNPGKNP